MMWSQNLVSIQIKYIYKLSVSLCMVVLDLHLLYKQYVCCKWRLSTVFLHRKHHIYRQLNQMWALKTIECIECPDFLGGMYERGEERWHEVCINCSTEKLSLWEDKSRYRLEHPDTPYVNMCAVSILICNDWLCENTFMNSPRCLIF